MRTHAPEDGSTVSPTVMVPKRGAVEKGTVLIGIVCVALLQPNCTKSVNQIVPPTANAGIGGSAPTGAEIILDGTKSHTADGRGAEALEFHWSIIAKPEDSTETLSDPTSPQPTLVIDAIGEYIFRLVVSHGGVESRPDERAWFRRIGWE